MCVFLIQFLHIFSCFVFILHIRLCKLQQELRSKKVIEGVVHGAC